MAVFRTQEMRERCQLCDQVGEVRCSKCQVWSCAAHRGRTFECCSACDGELELAISRAGLGKRGAGAALVLITAVMTYTCAALHMMTPFVTAALAAGGASGLGLLGWSYGLSRRLTRRQVARQLAARKALAAPRILPDE